MTSVKSEIHNITQCCQRKTESRTGKNLVKLSHVVFKLCERTDRQTDRLVSDRHTHYNTSQPYRGEVKMPQQRQQGNHGFIAAGSSFFLRNHLVDSDMVPVAGLASFRGRTWSSEVVEKTFGSSTPDRGSVMQHPGVRLIHHLSVCYSD